MNAAVFDHTEYNPLAPDSDPGTNVYRLVRHTAQKSEWGARQPGPGAYDNLAARVQEPLWVHDRCRYDPNTHRARHKCTVLNTQDCVQAKLD